MIIHVTFILLIMIIRFNNAIRVGLFGILRHVGNYDHLLPWVSNDCHSVFYKITLHLVKID